MVLIPKRLFVFKRDSSNNTVYLFASHLRIVAERRMTEIKCAELSEGKVGVLPNEEVFGVVLVAEAAGADAVEQLDVLLPLRVRGGLHGLRVVAQGPLRPRLRTGNVLLDPTGPVVQVVDHVVVVVVAVVVQVIVLDGGWSRPVAEGQRTIRVSALVHRGGFGLRLWRGFISCRLLDWRGLLWELVRHTF